MRYFGQKGGIGIVLLLVLLASVTLLYADPGDLDLTFGGGGYVTTDITTEDTGIDLVIDSAGRIIVAVQEYSEPFVYGLVARYNPDGNLDTDFGDEGIVTLPFEQDDVTYVNGLALDSNEKIVIVGGNIMQGFLLRLNPDGSLDTTFGDQGIVNDGGGSSLGISTDNKITVVQSDATGHSHLVRYDAVGLLDPTFGEGGITTSVPIQAASSLIPQADGGFVIISGALSVALAKYTSFGHLDLTFGDNGMVITDPGEVGVASGIQDSEGRIVLTGGITDYSSGSPGGIQNVMLIRYLPDGTLDPDFGENGVVITANVQDGSYGNAVLTDASDRLIVAGHSVERFEEPFHSVFSIFIARYNPDGSLDTTFGGGDGITLWRPSPDPDEIYDYYNFVSSAVLDAAGRIVVTGDTGWNDPDYITGVSDILLLRYEVDLPITVTETATTDPAATQTPTSTETPPAEIYLIDNGGFEANGGSVADWQIKNATKDKVKCDASGKPPVAYEGNCAFRFKGGIGENSQIFQKPDLEGLNFASGDVFTLQAYVHARGQVDFQVQAKFTYTDDTKEKIALDLAEVTDAYTLFVDDYMLISAGLVKIKVALKNRSTSGKIDVDEISLNYSPTESMLLPLP